MSALGAEVVGEVIEEACSECSQPLGAEPVCSECRAKDVAGAVREWAERQRLLGLLPPGVFAELERCAADLRDAA